ncbi:hypothetical protein GE061_006501 [Apolygus lucorum]|uniref:Uncharacterized protein n=1 Tax=Apolygus lucorum TaxID=248454 RepID=A0A6A4J7Z9_APOLU|nr:hypothetical protein GE061_006501 [Apolygus lucorum]
MLLCFRNPWSGGHSESRSSSASSQAYHVIPPNHYVQVDPCWDTDGQCHLMGHLGREAGPQHAIVGPQHAIVGPQHAIVGPQHPNQVGLATAVTPTGVYLVPKTLPPRPHHFTPATESTGRRSRPMSSGAATPVSGGYGASETAVLPCGGHCVALETFCHHLLQVLFVAGILTGICLVVAGSALKGRGRRGPDLSVLTYIGAMVSLVSGLLLAIQCCSRPRPRPRRPRQGHSSAGHALSGGHVLASGSHTLSSLPPRGEEIPLQPMQPLLGTLQRHPHGFMPHDHHENFNCRNDGGIPWWRRDNDSAA